MLSQKFLEELWYGDHPLSLFLAPAGWLYAAVMMLRRLAYASGMLPAQRVAVPVIVVGNITVGGTGKTPLIIWIAEYLMAQGYRPGVVSRGYGGKAQKWPQQVRPDSNPFMVGDEPVLISQRLHCPVAVSPKRYIAAKELLEHTDCDVLLCDDGLQHLSLARDIEIAVIDGDRRFGNGRCLPAGPLREPVSRLKKVDMVVSNGKPGKNEHLMEYVPGKLQSLVDDGQEKELEDFRGQEMHVVTGIGNPARFYSYLRKFEIRIIKHEFPDHHSFVPQDLKFSDELPVVMTEKDAVKCRGYANKRFWYLPVSAKLGDAFQHRFSILLGELFNG